MRRSPLRRTPFGAPSHARAEPPAFNPAAAKAALEARQRSQTTPRVFRPPVSPGVPASAKPKHTGFSPVVRQTIIDRDRHTCQRCGIGLVGASIGYSLQHRTGRMMGGTDDPAINRPGNGLTLCGSGTTGCHGWVESHPTEAAKAGWAVESWADPTTVPVRTPSGWQLLNDRGYSWSTTPPPNGDAHAVAVRRTR
jgi:hypothetical protein